jgi:hypothetical protein
MIEISHESPICILNESREYNDYDYALVHLFEESEKYYDFFVDSLKRGRTVYLDNSIFELGESFNSEKYSKWIKKLQPTLYIVPDTLEDSQSTMSKYSDWINDKDTNCLPGIKMGVVQGETWQDLVECYRYMSYHADMIAISFDYSYYQITGEGDNKLMRYCTGRQKFIDELIRNNIWNHNKPHHLLGCSLAREFRHYTNISSITSIDTSNPVVAAINNIKYLKGIGLNDKPSSLLADLINHKLTSTQLDLVIYNTTQFKNIIDR